MLRNANLSAIVFLSLIPVCEINRNGEPWFVAKDLCDALELENTSRALSRLDDHEKAEVTLSYTGSNGVIQNRNVAIVSESGMYSLVLTSRKPEAKAFKKWVNTQTTLIAQKL